MGIRCRAVFWRRNMLLVSRLFGSPFKWTSLANRPRDFGFGDSRVCFEKARPLVTNRREFREGMGPAVAGKIDSGALRRASGLGDDLAAQEPQQEA